MSTNKKTLDPLDFLIGVVDCFMEIPGAATLEMIKYGFDSVPDEISIMRLQEGCCDICVTMRDNEIWDCSSSQLKQFRSQVKKHLCDV